MEVSALERLVEVAVVELTGPADAEDEVSLNLFFLPTPTGSSTE